MSDNALLICLGLALIAFGLVNVLQADVGRCEDRGGISILSEDLTVVCLDPEAVLPEQK